MASEVIKHVFGSETDTPNAGESCESVECLLVFHVCLQAKAFYSYWSEPATIRNLKRGLASLFQVQLKSGKVLEVIVVLKLLSVHVCTDCLPTA